VEQPEITFIVGYPCPNCRATLEARSGDAYGWLRCPKCGRASLPPEHMRETPAERPPLGDDVLVIGPSPEDRRVATVGASPHRSRAFPGGFRRIAVATGLIISLTFVVISVLDGNVLNAMIFGVVGLVLFGVLLQSSRRR
jgi:hypothetical protein